MSDELSASAAGVPRPIVIGFALFGVLAMITGAGEGSPTPAATPPAHFDTAFVRVNGFMMDSLRLGRLRLAHDSIAGVGEVGVQHAAPTPAPRPKAPPSPRGCMPE